MTKLKNYTSNSANTFNNIQKCLAEHKAQQIMFDYNDNGKIAGVAFALKIDERMVGFKLPARVEKVEQIFLEEKKNKPRNRYYYGTMTLTTDEKDQAYRTAWANIKDWIVAQMAMIDTGMVKPEEVFLPYAVTREGVTYFEAIKNNNFMLGSGAENGDVI